jgi:SAM-dependent methyltransferase
VPSDEAEATHGRVDSEPVVIPKPAHLGPQYGSQFDDDAVAHAYDTRPPYPPESFDILETLMAPGRRTVLDLGCGTGDVALGLLDRADRVDALDASVAMLRVAQGRRRASDPRLRWLEARAEEFRPDARYSLLVAAESFHWMEWHEVLSWIPGALLPGALLCLVSGREIGPTPWAPTVGQLIARYSTNRAYRPYDLVSELTLRGLFVETGRAVTAPVAFEQSLDGYIESFHTRNGLSRARMGASAAAFDDSLRRIVAAYCPDGTVRGPTRATLVWGRPLRPAQRTRSTGEPTVDTAG